MNQFKIYTFLIACTFGLSSIYGQFQTASTIKVEPSDSKETIIAKAAHVVPTANQYSALKNEFIAFIHFGPNTFTRMEWGNGKEDPKIFDLKNLDTDQWCKAMKSAGMKMVVFTAKHHDGFVLWQSRYTKHGVMSSPFKNGNGDILKDLSASCQKYGLKLGVYLSPADLYQIENREGLYGNLSTYSDRIIPRPIPGRPFENKTTFTFNVDDYNEYFLNQLFELLTEYGPIHEVWFDGAHPKRKGGQKYNYLAWKELIQTLAPEAVIFGKQDLRWCGNESGGTRDTEWNVIPYNEDPGLLNRFGDLTNEDLGSREKLYKGSYLHYQQAETNTSIREGWFYRDDTSQKVRSVDDVFDIYERSVGGNSTYLLNIPPNREGLFSPEDVRVLKEVGKRIEETYGNNLFEKATGSTSALDHDTTTFELVKENSEIIISTPSPIKINRIVIQEAITTHSERVENHALDAWINGAWQEIVSATNIGYKRILRFPETISDKFRVRILNARLTPAISNITAHYYKSRPPQLSISRNLNGELIIAPKQHDFGWKPHGENTAENLNADFEIRYTTDGSTPNKTSKLFKKGITIESKEIKAIAISKDDLGSIAQNNLGILKQGWKIENVSSQHKKNKASFVFDENQKTYWQSDSSSNKNHAITIAFSTKHSLTGFAYTPQTSHSNGMIEEGYIEVSLDGKKWVKVENFRFGNLINDPVKRTHKFKKAVSAKFVRLTSTVIAGEGSSAAIAELDFFETN